MLKKIVFISATTALMSLQGQVIEDGEYNIKSKQSGLCMTRESTETNSRIIQALCDKEDSKQQFTINHLNNNKFTLSSVGVAHNSPSNGAGLYSRNNGGKFKIQQKNSAYKIKALPSKKYITAKPYSNEIIQYHAHNSDDQLWEITSIDDTPVEPPIGGGEYFNDFSLYTSGELIQDYYREGIFTDGFEQFTTLDFRGRGSLTYKVPMRQSGKYYYEYNVLEQGADNYVGISVFDVKTHGADAYIYSNTGTKIGWVVDFDKGEFRGYADGQPFTFQTHHAENYGQSLFGHIFKFDKSLTYLYLGFGSGSGSSSLVEISDTVTMKDIMDE